VCAKVGGKCSQKALDDLGLSRYSQSPDKLKQAYEGATGASLTCRRWNKGCQGGNCGRWGLPFIHSSHFNDKLCWGGDAAAPCGQKPVDGHHRRLCPCVMSQASAAAKETAAKRAAADKLAAAAGAALKAAKDAAARLAADKAARAAAAKVAADKAAKEEADRKAKEAADALVAATKAAKAAADKAAKDAADKLAADKAARAAAAKLAADKAAKDEADRVAKIVAAELAAAKKLAADQAAAAAAAASSCRDKGATWRPSEKFKKTAKLPQELIDDCSYYAYNSNNAFFARTIKARIARGGKYGYNCEVGKSSPVRRRTTGGDAKENCAKSCGYCK